MRHSKHIATLLTLSCWVLQSACLSDDAGSSSSDTTVVDVNPGLNETCSAWEPTRAANSIELEPIAAGGWERSVFALQTERFPSRWYIAEQRGVVSFYDEITEERSTVFDGQSLVLSHEDPGGHYKEEQGLLSLAFRDEAGDVNFTSRIRSAQHQVLSSLGCSLSIAWVRACLKMSLGR